MRMVSMGYSAFGRADWRHIFQDKSWSPLTGHTVTRKCIICSTSTTFTASDSHGLAVFINTHEGCVERRRGR